VETGRLEAFSDGVFAIAATLLVLLIEVPRDAGDGLGHALVNQWPQYLAYVLSFVAIGIMWVNHHAVLTHFERADRPFLFLNLGLLMCIAFAPFPTALVAEHLHERTAALAYGLSFTVTALFFNGVWHYGRLRLLRPDADMREVRGITRSYIPGPLMYGGATLVAFLSAPASVALYCVIAAVYVSASIWAGGADD
jgi:uncharacterized membrane protein